MGEPWIVKLSRLDMDRECTALGSDDCCWLCDNLEEWNNVLNPLRLDLVEQQPGRLCLVTRVRENVTDVLVFQNAHYFTQWLPRKHRCVVAADLRKGHLHTCGVTLPASVAARPSNVSCVSITGNTQFGWSPVLDAVASRDRLESLVLSDVGVDEGFAAVVAQTLSENAHSLRRVSVSKRSVPYRSADIIMGALPNCTRLKELTFEPRLGLSARQDLAKVLKSAEFLEKLTVLCDCETIAAAIGDRLRANTSLTELRCKVFQSAFRNIVRAIEGNSRLRVLGMIVLQDDLRLTERDTGAIFKSLLVKNKGLRSLSFDGCDINTDGAQLIFEGLRQNSSLQNLEFLHFCVVDAQSVQTLCKALNFNTTLRLLQFGLFEATTSEREALSAQLAHDKCYGRVKLAQWLNSDARGLCASLTEPSLCPVELQICPLDVTADSFTQLCKALSSSLHVQGLTVELLNADRSRLTCVRDMLKANTSLKRLTLTSNDFNPDSSAQVSLGLLSNTSVRELTLNFCHFKTSSGLLLEKLMETNKTLSKMSITCYFEPSPGCFAALCRGLLRNKYMVDFSVVRWKDVDCWHPTAGMAVQRNVSRLHRAVCFVLEPNVERSRAEAFEHFESKASLVSRLMSAAGMTEKEAQAAVCSARRFIANHYFFITGLFCRNLECYAGNGTQIDALNSDCLLAIAKHLKVSDVLVRRLSKC